MKNNDLIQRTKIFADHCMELAMFLPENLLGSYVAGELIKSSSAVAVNYRASCITNSNKKFLSKIDDVIECADQSAYWLELTIDKQLLENKEIKCIIIEAENLINLLKTIRQ